MVSRGWCRVTYSPALLVAAQDSPNYVADLERHLNVFMLEPAARVSHQGGLSHLGYRIVRIDHFDHRVLIISRYCFDPIQAWCS
jgi:hypothetical protein